MPNQKPDPEAVFARSLARAQKLEVTDAQRKAIADAAGGDAQKAATLEALLRIENRGFQTPNEDAVSPQGAYGAWQFMRSTWEQFGRQHGEGDFRNAGDFEKGARNASRFVDWIAKRYNSTDPAVIAAYYNGGGKPAYAEAQGKDLSPGETADYVRMMRGLVPAAPEQTDSDSP